MIPQHVKSSIRQMWPAWLVIALLMLMSLWLISRPVKSRGSLPSTGAGSGTGGSVVLSR